MLGPSQSAQQQGVLSMLGVLLYSHDGAAAARGRGDRGLVIRHRLRRRDCHHDRPVLLRWSPLEGALQRARTGRVRGGGRRVPGARHGPVRDPDRGRTGGGPCCRPPYRFAVGLGLAVWCETHGEVSTPEPYSPECVEGKFCELRLEGVLLEFARLAFASTLPSGTREVLRGRV
jgi:hypothetical protein